MNSVERLSLQDRVLFVTGASRGIGRSIALAAAAQGARLVLAAKTETPHPSLPGTVHETAAAVAALGAQALPLVLDVRDEAAVAQAVSQAAAHFGRIDALINNASAIYLAGVTDTPMKRYDLMMDVNVRGSFVCAQACLPYLLQSDNPHIVSLSPPIDLAAHWFQHHTAYTMSKYGMSMLVLGLAAEYRAQGVAVNAVWPRTLIDTAALNMVGQVDTARCRQPQIVADAVLALLQRPARSGTGQFWLDENLLREAGVEDFSRYQIDPSTEPWVDLFLPGFVPPGR